jgi:hypothetical protein
VFQQTVTHDLLSLDSDFGSEDNAASGPSSIYLVTNRVDWYNRFPHWDNHDWNNVQHSVTFSRTPVVRRRSEETSTLTKNNREEEKRYQQGMQMWSDWYTLLNAKLIYHTHSDFSVSAARWNQRIRSWTILDSELKSSVDENGFVAGDNTLPSLNLEPDFLEQETATVPPLFQRSDPDLSSTSVLSVNGFELKHCGAVAAPTSETTTTASGVEVFEQMKNEQLERLIASRQKLLEDSHRVLPTLASN